VAGDGHAADLEGGSHDAVAEGEVIADHLDPQQHLFEVARDGDLLDRIGELTWFTPGPISSVT
jgi:hypothetical protein